MIKTHKYKITNALYFLSYNSRLKLSLIKIAEKWITGPSLPLLAFCLGIPSLEYNARDMQIAHYKMMISLFVF